MTSDMATSFLYRTSLKKGFNKDDVAGSVDLVNSSLLNEGIDNEQPTKLDALIVTEGKN